MGEFESNALGRVTVYSIQGCPHCLQAKATLGRLEIPVCDVDVGKHPELRARVKELTGRSTVPQIFFNNVHVGGNDDLQKLVRRRRNLRLTSCSVLQVFEQCQKFHIHLPLFKSLCKLVCKWRSVLLPQAPEELQRLVNLVKEQPLPADAPPLPEENQSEDTPGEMDGGEWLIVQIF